MAINETLFIRLCFQGKMKVRGLLNAGRTVYRYGGSLAFFKGLNARVLYQMPSTAICWSTYEFFKFFFISRKEEHEERKRYLHASCVFCYLYRICIVRLLDYQLLLACLSFYCSFVLLLHWYNFTWTLYESDISQLTLPLYLLVLDCFVSQCLGSLQ